MIQGLQQEFQQYLGAHMMNGQPRELFEPIHYSFKKEGKQLRPLALLLCNKLYQGNLEEALPIATAIECFHNFTLIHDDIMDGAQQRRGQVAAYKKFGVNNAILSGDALMIQVYKYLESLPGDKLSVVIKIFNNLALDVCRGQSYDMLFEQEEEIAEDQYLEMIRLKTAVLFAGSVKIGVFLANENLLEAQIMYDLCEKMGLAFQIKDDLLDCFGESKETGKQKGGDILNRKKTLLWIRAIKKTKEDAPECFELMSQRELNSENVDAIIDYWRKLEIDKDVEATISKYVNQAKVQLDQLTLSQENKNYLWNFLYQFIDRKQ